MYKTGNTTEIVLHLAGLTNQFLNGTHAGVLRTGSDQKGPTRGSEPYSSLAPLGQSTRIGKKCTRALRVFALKIGQNQFFSAGQNGQMECDLRLTLAPTLTPTLTLTTLNNYKPLKKVNEQR